MAKGGSIIGDPLMIGLIIVAIFGFLFQIRGGVNTSQDIFTNSPTTKNERVESTSGKSGRGLSQNDIARELVLIEKEVRRITDEIRSSTYKGYADISARGARETRAKEEYVEIKFSRSLPGLVNISGWSLESARSGRRFSIGAADTLPLDRFRETDPVVVSGGDKVFVHSGKSPVRVSFKSNICTGYLDYDEDFIPRLPRECPLLIDDIPDSLSYGKKSLRDSCLRRIEKIRKCEVPDEDELEEIKFAGGSKCEEVVEKYADYDECVRNNRSSTNFMRPEWHIYIGRATEFWRQEREIITLYDEGGKVVDVVSY
jgi:hypothetical protein